MEVSEMITKTREVTELFRLLEPRPWSVEAMVVELTAELGTLADSMMIAEGYREIRDGDTLDLEDDIADVVFMLLRIADYFSIDVEKAYEQMIGRTKDRLIGYAQTRRT